MLAVERDPGFAAKAVGQAPAQQRIAHRVDVVDTQIPAVLFQQHALEARHALAQIQVGTAVADPAVDTLAGQDQAQVFADGAVIDAADDLGNQADVDVADGPILDFAGNHGFRHARFARRLDSLADHARLNPD